MLIEVVALQPPHDNQGIVTIQFKKLLTGESGKVNTLNSILRGSFAQENSCYHAKCGKSFHDDPCFALGTPGRHGEDRLTGDIQSYRRLRRILSTRCLILSAVRRLALRSKLSAMTRNSAAISINAIFA
jgi:hypothetical protein